MAISKQHPYRFRGSRSLRAGAGRTWHALVESVRHPIQSGLARLILVMALLVGLYALAGFVLAPRLLRTYLVDLTHEKYGRELSLGPVRVNPFKFTVELEDIGLPDADGKALLEAGRLFVDFEGPTSLWERAFVFREITLERPHVRCVVRRDGRVNLGDLAGEQEPAQVERAGENKLIALWIQALSVEPRIASTGQLAISGFQLPTVKEYANEWLTFAISRGSLDVHGTYSVSLGKQPNADVNLASIAVRNLTLSSRDKSALIQIPSVTAENTNVTLLQRSVSIACCPRSKQRSPRRPRMLHPLPSTPRPLGP
jgi:hypothetical protein